MISSFYWSCWHATSWDNKGHCCEQSQLLEKDGLHCDPLPYTLNFSHISPGRKRTLGRAVPAADTLAASPPGKRCRRLCKTFPFVKYTKVQRIRSYFSCILWFFIESSIQSCGGFFGMTLSIVCGARWGMSIYTFRIVFITWSLN